MSLQRISDFAENQGDKLLIFENAQKTSLVTCGSFRLDKLF